MPHPIQVLYAYFEKMFPVSEKDIDLIKSLFIHKLFKKGEFFLREGEVAKYGAFIARGCLRSYVIDEKGKEHIVQFAPENWWLADMNSLANKTPTRFFMDALEDSDLFLIDDFAFNKLLKELPGFAASYQAGIQKHTAGKDKRIIATLTASASERYNDFLQTYPSIAQRVPQHMLASYLGISPETLSRIRKQLSRKK